MTTDSDPQGLNPLPGSVDLNEGRLQALELLAETLAQGAPLETVLSQAVDTVRSALDLSCVAMLLLEDSAPRMRVRIGSGLSEACRESLQGGCPWPTDAPDPRPLVSQDQPAAFASCGPAFLAEGIPSLAFVPLRSHGRLAGAFLLGSHRALRLRPGDLSYASTIGNLVMSAIADGLQGNAAGPAAPEVQRRMEVLRVSEEKFSKIFHLSPDAIDLTRLKDGVTLDCNQSYVKLTGYAREEIIGHSTLPGDLGIWVNREDRDRFTALLRAEGEVGHFEARLRRKDGSTYYGLLSSTTLEINGELCNLDLTWDITEQKINHEALRISEEKFSKTFKLSPDAITITRLEDGVYLDANEGFTEMTGHLTAEILDRSSWSGDQAFWVQPKELEVFLSELSDKGEVTNLEAQFRRKDGSVRVGMLSARLINLWDEPCVLTISRDVTKQKQAEGALRESSWRLQLALESSNLGIWDRDLQDDREIWDDRTYEIYGLTRAESAPDFSTWLERVVHPEDASRLRDALKAALEGRQPYDLKFRIIRPDGAIRHVSSHGIVIRAPGGRPLRVIGVNQDQTEQVEVEAERRRLQAEVTQAEKLESLGSLAGGVAHDMNNVLTAILITTERIHELCRQDEAIARALRLILHAGQRGQNLVKALTDFARKGLAEVAPVNLNEVLRKEVELLRHTTLQRIAVVLDLDERLPAVMGVASDLGSALMNLSINAVDAMPEGGTLTFRSRALEDGWIELEVADTGTGMPPGVMDKAMDPFFTTKPVGKGTGLGLSRVYGTVRAHGGTMRIQSRVGQGTTVSLRLPLPPGVHPSQKREESVPVGQGTPLRILLVDDEYIILESIPPMLASLGHVVRTAPHGEEALRCLESPEDFDLVILDHNMPGMTGADALRRLRRLRPALPVIFSSGFLDAQTEALLADTPHVWMLKKPYRMWDMQRALAEVAQLDVK